MTSPVARMFGRIAGVYDFLNHALSLGIDKAWRRELAALTATASNPALPLLDLAAGTLDVAITLAKAHPGATIMAMDFCQPMLLRGIRKLTRLNDRQILTACADARQLPLPDASVSCVTMAFGIRNIQPRVTAFREIARVLAPGGRVCILEFGSASERIWGGMYNWYLMNVLPLIGRTVARDNEAYAYLARTIREFPAATQLAKEMEDGGLVNVGYHKLTGGIVCLHWAEKEWTNIGKR